MLLTILYPTNTVTACAQLHVCKIHSRPAERAALFYIYWELQMSAPFISQLSLCVFPREDGSHLDEPWMLCVLVIYRTSGRVQRAAVSRGSYSEGLGLVLGNTAVFVERFVRAKKENVSRGGLGGTGRPSVAIFAAFVCLHSCACTIFSGSCVQRGTSVNIWVHRLCLAFQQLGEIDA